MYRNTVDGEFYDYVLVTGDVDPFAEAPAGPVFRPAARADGLTLFEKVPASGGAPSSPDEGPCATSAHFMDRR